MIEQNGILESRYIELITDFNQSVPILLKIIKELKINSKPLAIDCSHNSQLSEDTLREII